MSSPRFSLAPLPTTAALSLLFAAPLAAQTVPSAPAAAILGSGTETVNTDMMQRIRDEGMNRSQVMQTVSYLTDVIGPRLTGVTVAETGERVDQDSADRLGPAERSA